MPLFQGNAIPSATGYDIDISVRFNTSDSSFLDKQFSSAGNKRTWTFSCWIKLGNPGDHYDDGLKHIFGAGGGGANSYNSQLVLKSDHSLQFLTNVPAPTTHLDIRTNRKFRDPTQWYHILLAIDTTQGTASNRVKLYVNGAQETSLQTSTYPSQNLELYVNNNLSLIHI